VTVTKEIFTRDRRQASLQTYRLMQVGSCLSKISVGKMWKNHW